MAGTLETNSTISISKLGLAHYLRLYDEILGPFADKEFTLLEIGIANGDSLYYWRDKYLKAKIVGIDINPVALQDSSGRIKTYVGEQQNCDFLTQVAMENAPNGFDVIIDDGSHIGHYTRISFWHLFRNYLKAGGYYFIEDWGTGYWDKYFDGKKFTPRPVKMTCAENLISSIERMRFVTQSTLLSKLARYARYRSMRRTFPSHQRGMVGFVKELVDECGAPDMTDDRFGNPPKRSSLIDWMRVSVGHVLVRRR